MTAPTLLTRLEAYLRQYVTFADPAYCTAVALWIIGTHLWAHFDAFPYLVITSDTKQSGKTRLAELMSYASANPFNLAGMTAATVYTLIRDNAPTLFMDEAETLQSESATVMRSVLNVGYRRGQTVPRITATGIVQWPTYCPKCFILIGDVYDTLRDRSIIVRMNRASVPQRFVFTVAQSEGRELRDAIAAWAAEHAGQLAGAYQSFAGAAWLPGRDEEIWTPLLLIGEAMGADVRSIAVDMATEKTVTARRQITVKGAEDAAEADTYALRLLADVAEILGWKDGERAAKRDIATADLLAKLHALPLGPWRKFRGTGLTAIDMANLLARFQGLRPRNMRAGPKSRGTYGKVVKGYKAVDVMTALKAVRP